MQWWLFNTVGEDAGKLLDNWFRYYEYYREVVMTLLIVEENCGWGATSDCSDRMLHENGERIIQETSNAGLGSMPPRAIQAFLGRIFP